MTSDRPASTLPFTLAQILGTVVMTLASVYWVAIDYPDWLPDAWLRAMPQPALSTLANWGIIVIGTGLGWAMYQWGTSRKATLARSRR